LRAALLVFLWPTHRLAAQAVQESFATDPIPSARFVQRIDNTESAFIFNPTSQNLTAVLDADASPAYYLSKTFAPLTDAQDSTFSSRFQVTAVDPRDHPAVFVGLLTDQHVGDFGDGLAMVLTVAGSALVAHADIESFDQTYSGNAVALDLRTEYLVVGRYQGASRQFAIEIFSGTGFTNLVGYSVATLPKGQSISVNRVGMQNAGARDLDGSVGSISLIVDDIFAPGNNPRTLSIADVNLTEGNSGSTNAVFQVRLSPPSGLPVTVSFATEDGTARAGL
jgi:hypothetical protein